MKLIYTRLIKIGILTMVIASFLYLAWAPRYIYDKTMPGNDFSVDDIAPVDKDGWLDTKQISLWNYSQVLSNVTNDFIDIEAMGNYMYVAVGNDGLWVLEISDWHNPAILERLNYSGGVWGLLRVDDHLFLATDDDGLTITDLTLPAQPSTIGTFSNGSTNWTFDVGLFTASKKREIVANENLLFLSNLDKGFSVMNISVLSNPTTLGIGSNGSGIVNDLFFKDELLYVADAGDGLEIYNVSNPVLPSKIGYFCDGTGEPYDGEARGVVIKDEYAYVADGYEEIEIINVMDPQNPFEGTSNDFHYYMSTSVEIFDGVLFVVNNFGHISIYSIIDQTSISWLTGKSFEYTINDVSWYWPWITEFYVYDTNTGIICDNHGIIVILDLGRDLDGDYMVDWWEKENNVDDPDADPDFDGWTNIQEFHERGDPHKSRYSIFYYILYGISFLCFGGGIATFIILRRKQIL